MQNFLNSRPKMSSQAVPSDAFRASNENANISKLEVVSSGNDQPKVELVTEAGIISSIVITCKCGERIELKCHY